MTARVCRMAVAAPTSCIMRRMPSTQSVLARLLGCRLKAMMASTVRAKLRSNAPMVFSRSARVSAVSMAADESTSAKA